jgi:hypothetical protein
MATRMPPGRVGKLKRSKLARPQVKTLLRRISNAPLRERAAIRAASIREITEKMMQDPIFKKTLEQIETRNPGILKKTPREMVGKVMAGYFSNKKRARGRVINAQRRSC